MRLQLPRARKESRLLQFIVYGLAGAGAWGALHWFATSVVFQNDAEPPVSSGLPVEDVWLDTEDGVRIHGWWVPSKGARVATLFLHGNAGNIGHRVDHIAEIVAAGSDLLIIDYRGYGGNPGRPSERGLCADANAAYAYLQQKHKPIVIHGESLGSAVAVDLASRRPAAGLILEAPFTSLSAMADRSAPVVGRLLLWGFDSKGKIPQIETPLLVIHGDRDSVVPYPLGRELYETATGRKTFWTVPGADHNNILLTAGPEYGKRLRQFYDTL